MFFFRIVENPDDDFLVMLVRIPGVLNSALMSRSYANDCFFSA